jgi:glutamyl-tRNA reductase
MHLILVGLSHKTAPVEIREKISIPPEKQEEALTRLIKMPAIKEAVILSTCNRTELYCAASGELENGVEQVIGFLSDLHSIENESLKKHLYYLHSREMINHLFVVSSSLDSMVLGEAQILGQVKEAYSYALDFGTTGLVLNRLFQEAISIGKKVRTDTEIGENAVSISYAAVELAKMIFGSLTGRRAMLVGAGKMSELTAKHLHSNGVKEIIVANRTYERSVELAEKFNGTPVAFDDLTEYLQQADIVVSSTGAPHIIITKQQMIEVMHKRKNRPIFLIDIAVPRDIEPSINELYNTYLYDVDDLQGVVDSNLAAREKEAEKAKEIIEQSADDFLRWMASLDVVPTITELRQKAEEICSSEVEKALAKLGDIGEEKAGILSAMAKAITNKILHEPIVKIKHLAGKGEGYDHIESLRELFSLNGSKPKQTVADNTPVKKEAKIEK